MPNQNYIRGRRKEYALMQKLRDEGYNDVMRTAGSHGVFDIIAIDTFDRKIKFIQAKSGKSQEREKAKLDFSKYHGLFEVEAEAV